jgi:hypothetical protein
MKADQEIAFSLRRRRRKASPIRPEPSKASDAGSGMLLRMT